jgi:hypothetical protein
MTNPYLEKRASLSGGAAMAHVAQNIATNQALKSKHVAKYLANSLTQGFHGVVDTSLKSKALRSAASVITPDVAAAHKAAHEVGGSLKDILSKATKRQRAAARMVVEGNFDKIHKYRMHEDPVVKAVHGVIAKHLPTLGDLSHSSKSVQQLWKDKGHPLLSNIAAHIGRGEVPKGARFKPGHLTQTIPAISSSLIAPIEPGAAVLDGVKALSGSKAVQGNKYGKKAVDFLSKTFIKDPLKKGVESKGHVGGIGHEASKIFINPTSAHLKRTAAAITHATDSH